MEAKSAELPPGVEFSIIRVLNAPRERVFKAWSEAEQLGQWWGAKGSGIRIINLDFRAGGGFHYAMQLPNGSEIWGKFTYEEIQPPERIVFISSFADAEGNTIRNPFSAAWPLQVRNTLTLTESAGTTTLNLRGGPHQASDAEQKMFAFAHPAMQMGFGGTFDQLDAWLTRAAKPG